MTEVNKILYKKDTKGKIRFLNISTNNGELIQESGLIGGKSVIHSSICTPKNVGRANETNSQEQAISEAESKILKKLDEGYFENLIDAETEEVILPMLAKDFKKEYKKIEWPCFIQPKLDGMRALYSRANGFVSRQGKSIETIQHINPNISGKILDGELYAHDKTFQENMSLIKKYREGESEQIRYNVYDLVSAHPFEDRYRELEMLVGGQDNINLVPTYQVNNLDEVQSYHQQFIAKGYEGSIVRWGIDGYKVNGRSSNLLKYKDFIDIVYEVIDVEPSDRNPEQGIVICKGVDNSGHEITFGCGMKFSHAEREEILRNKEEYIGKTAEIRFFEFTDDGIPRFPVCYGFRLDK